ncbi:MAG TPA: hypothetical protein GX522_08785 [Firmicutes bacterium]|jgi:hypothetical protein|nr:hypothetical protein [Bacillota bacterium]
MSLSTKELNFIKDGLSWEMLMVKKYTDHAQGCQDPELKSVFDGLARMHQSRYDHLFGHISGRTMSH